MKGQSECQGVVERHYGVAILLCFVSSTTLRTCYILNGTQDCTCKKMTSIRYTLKHKLLAMFYIVKYFEFPNYPLQSLLGIWKHELITHSFINLRNMCEFFPQALAQELTKEGKVLT